jgi:hypothetical protein
MVEDKAAVTPPATLLERDRKRFEELLARKELGPEVEALLLNLLQAEDAAASGDNQLRCALWELSAVLVYLNKSHPVFLGLDAMGLNPLGLLKTLHNAAQDYGAGVPAPLNAMRGAMPDGRRNAAAPSEAQERAVIAWCVHCLALGGRQNGAFTVNDAAREVSKFLKRIGLPRNYLTVRSIYYAVRGGEDAEDARWFEILKAEPAANPPEAPRQSKAERLAWLNGVTFFNR